MVNVTKVQIKLKLITLHRSNSVSYPGIGKETVDLFFGIRGLSGEGPSRVSAFLTPTMIPFLIVTLRLTSSFYKTDIFVDFFFKFRKFQSLLTTVLLHMSVPHDARL